MNKIPPYNAELIANYFLEKSFEEGCYIVTLKLIKLIYVAHGWNLALRNEELLYEHIKFDKFGPNIESVYEIFGSEYGSQPICNLSEQNNNTSSIDDDTKSVLKRVWDVYKVYSELQLSTIAHKEGSPWYSLNEDIHSGKTQFTPFIPNWMIKEYYTNLSNKKEDYGIKNKL